MASAADPLQARMMQALSTENYFEAALIKLEVKLTVHASIMSLNLVYLAIPSIDVEKKILCFVSAIIYPTDGRKTSDVRAGDFQLAASKNRCYPQKQFSKCTHGTKFGRLYTHMYSCCLLLLLLCCREAEVSRPQ